MTVQDPVQKQQPNGMSHGGGASGPASCSAAACPARRRPPWASPAQTQPPAGTRVGQPIVSRTPPPPPPSLTVVGHSSSPEVAGLGPGCWHRRRRHERSVHRGPSPVPRIWRGLGRFTSTPPPERWSSAFNGALPPQFLWPSSLQSPASTHAHTIHYAHTQPSAAAAHVHAPPDGRARRTRLRRGWRVFNWRGGGQ